MGHGAGILGREWQPGINWPANGDRVTVCSVERIDGGCGHGKSSFWN